MKTLLLICLTWLIITNTKAQWQLARNTNGDKITSIAATSANIFAGNYGDGVLLSTNNGSSWSLEPNGLTNFYISSLTISGTDIFAASDIGGISLSTNNGSSWTTIASLVTNCLASNSTNIYAGTKAGVYLYTNNGSSWTSANIGLASNIVNTIAISGTNIFAGSAGGGVFLSTNNGSTWSAMNNGLTRDSINCIAIDNNQIFAGTNGGIFMSTNNGSTWTAVNNGLSSLNVYSFAFNGNNIIAGTNGGVFISACNGCKWDAMNTGLTTIGKVNCFAIQDTVIFAGMDDGRIWKRSLSQMTGIEEMNINQKLKIYPNPAAEKLIIEYPDFRNSTVEVINIDGKLLQKIMLQSAETTVNINNLGTGIYFFKVYNDNGMVVRKVIKQ